VVTGGSHRIGAHTMRLLAAQGVAVCAIGLDSAALDEVSGQVRATGVPRSACPADITDLAVIETARGEAEQRLGPVDVLVAFAGGGTARPGPTHQVTAAASSCWRGRPSLCPQPRWSNASAAMPRRANRLA
jgi:3-oxoacyl-[acyl-carrier protein] reductase